MSTFGYAQLAERSFFETNDSGITPESVTNITDVKIKKLPTVGESTRVHEAKGLFIVPDGLVGKLDGTTCRELASHIFGRDMASDTHYSFPPAKDFVSVENDSFDINSDNVRVLVLRCVQKRIK